METIPPKSDVWLTWQQVNKQSSGRKVVFYGRSDDWIHKAVEGLDSEAHYILDRQERYWGERYLGLEIRDPETFPLSDGYFVVITVADYEGPAALLESRGLAAGLDFSCSPDFRDLARVNDLRAQEESLLLSISDYQDVSRARSSFRGGGIYRYDGPFSELTQIYSGSTRQLCRLTAKKYLTVDFVSQKLLSIDVDFGVETIVTLDRPNYCGVAYDKRSDLVYCANAGTDQIIVISLQDRVVVETLQFRGDNTIQGQHHVNDLYIHDGHLYATCFSFSGSFKQGILDGGMVRYDLDHTKPEPVLVVGDLIKPHSPFVSGNYTYVLDSLRSQLLRGTLAEPISFTGFLRGFDEAMGGNLLVVGQSFNMYYSELPPNMSNAVPTNAGVYVVDTGNKQRALAKFIDLPDFRNVHDVKFIV